MRRRFLLLLFIVWSVASAFAQNARDLGEFKQVTSGNGVYVWQERSNSKKLNGKYHFVEDARTYYLVTFKDGVKNGVEECYKYNTLAVRTNYIGGIRCGEVEVYGTSFESRGKLVEKCTYNSQGRLEGKYTTYFTDGKIQSVREYHDGRKVGDEYQYTPDGTIVEEIHIYEKDGKKYKSVMEYSNDQGVQFKIEYTGVLGSDDWVVGKVGEYKETWHTGQVKRQEFYGNNGTKTGLWKEWYIDGGLKSEESFTSPRYLKEYSETGSLSSEIRYNEDGIRVTSRTYYENGALRQEELHKKGRSITKEFYDSGSLREEYIKNDSYEIAKEYHRNGQLRMVKERNRGDYGFKVTECYDDKGTSVPFIQL